MNVFRSIKGSLCLLENSSLTIKKFKLDILNAIISSSGIAHPSGYVHNHRL